MLFSRSTMNGFTPQQLSQMEGAKQFQDFIENDPNSSQEKGDFVIYDKLSDWRNWLHKKEVRLRVSIYLRVLFQ